MAIFQDRLSERISIIPLNLGFCRFIRANFCVLELYLLLSIIDYLLPPIYFKELKKQHSRVLQINTYSKVSDKPHKKSIRTIPRRKIIKDN